MALPTAYARAVAVEPLPPSFKYVELPDWGASAGIDGGLLVPEHCVSPGQSSAFERTDWLTAAHWYINGNAERAFEAAHGPIHSYSSRLEGWDARMWQRAWANRIALFLRCWAARHFCRDEYELLGPRPQHEIMLTHDIDAISKTFALRAKQAAFHCYNAARRAARGRFSSAGRKLRDAMRFAAVGGDLWYIDELAELERSRGLSSHFFVYGGDRRDKSLHLRLMDPSYDVAQPRLATALRELANSGCTIGLHQSFDSWNDAKRMQYEKTRVERAIGMQVTACRQHWLRFSWARTWQAQETAGLRLDATLGFNDRPGFRNGAALRFRPWCPERGRTLELESVPTMLMDSQLYDYADLTDDQREAEIGHWLEELRSVGGVASVIWHQHTLGPDYGWRGGFEFLLARLTPGG